MSKLSDTDIAVLAAMFSHSNMGHGLPRASSVASLKKSTRIDAASAVCHMCGHLMETDEHQDIFEQEARSWARKLKSAPLKLRESSPDIFAMYEAA